jgi:cyanate lyase
MKGSTVPQNQVDQTARQQLTDRIILAKMRKDLTWKELAEAGGSGVAYVTAALLGQHALSREAAETVGAKLDLGADDILLLQTIPMRGSIPDRIPTDPTIYRFYEALQVYGPALKELIHEQFGDGIMSAINFRMDFGRTEHAGADHVVVTFDGKFLPYAWPTD